MTCINLKEVERAAALLEKQAGTLRRISTEIDEASQSLKRNKTLLSAGVSMGKESGRLIEISDTIGQMKKALEMTVSYKRLAEQRITEKYEGSSRNVVSPGTVLVDCSKWEQLPEDILIY